MFSLFNKQQHRKAKLEDIKNQLDSTMLKMLETILGSDITLSKYSSSTYSQIRPKKRTIEIRSLLQT